MLKFAHFTATVLYMQVEALRPQEIPNSLPRDNSTRREVCLNMEWKKKKEKKTVRLSEARGIVLGHVAWNSVIWALELEPGLICVQGCPFPLQ